MVVRLDGLGDRLKEARKEAGYVSAKAFTDSGRCPVSYATLARWEGPNPGSPGFEELAKLADEYDCSLDWLAGRTSSKTGLPAGKVVVDLDALDRLRTARTLKDLGDTGDTGGIASFAFEVPQRIAVYGAREFAPINTEVDSLIRKLTQKRGGS